MRTLASSSGVVADFVQKKELGLLSVPLESRGRLYFIPPECMVWSITTPAESTLVIQGKRVSFSDGIRDQAIDLSQNRIARGFVEGFMVLFNGDHRSMKAQYEVGFHSGEDGWKLELVPRSPRLRRFIESIALSGRSGPLERMVLLEADGDRTTTTFERIEVEHHFDAEEIHDLFGPSSSCGRS
jgi:outer membrane lipoprotein-sorting protein